MFRTVASDTVDGWEEMLLGMLEVYGGTGWSSFTRRRRMGHALVFSPHPL